MIIEGYFFTELDSMQDDYESIAKSIEETLDNLYEEYLESIIEYGSPLAILVKSEDMKDHMMQTETLTNK